MRRLLLFLHGLGNTGLHVCQRLSGSLQKPRGALWGLGGELFFFLFFCLCGCQEQLFHPRRAGGRARLAASLAFTRRERRKGNAAIHSHIMHGENREALLVYRCSPVNASLSFRPSVKEDSCVSRPRKQKIKTVS